MTGDRHRAFQHHRVQRRGADREHQGGEAQAFIAWSTGAPIATIFRGIQRQGLDVPVGTTDGNMTYAQMKQYKDFLPKQLYIPAAQWVVTR